MVLEVNTAQRRGEADGNAPAHIDALTP